MNHFSASLYFFNKYKLTFDAWLPGRTACKPVTFKS